MSDGLTDQCLGTFKGVSGGYATGQVGYLRAVAVAGPLDDPDVVGPRGASCGLAASSKGSPLLAGGG